jgi:nucleotide-binding universal stress UspA family protein
MDVCQRLLVPLDGSPLAERALPPTIALARAFSRAKPCEIHLLRIVPPIMMALEPTLYSETIHLAEAESANYLADLQEQWQHEEIVIKTAVATGSPAETIINYAQENSIQLIIISSHGRSGLSRWVYGSVTEKVLRNACCATLVIRQELPADTAPFKKIMICLDGSETAEKVLPPALMLAENSGAEVVLYRAVLPAALFMEMDTAGQLLENVYALERDEAEAYLRSTLESLQPTPLRITTQTATGSAAEAIIDFAASENVDLIAMSSHGRSGLSRWVHGSVAEKVLRGASCATLILQSHSQTQ